MKLFANSLKSYHQNSNAIASFIGGHGYFINDARGADSHGAYMYIWREGGGRGQWWSLCIYGYTYIYIYIYIYIYLHACVVRGAVQTQARKFAHQEPETYCAFLHVVKPVGREQQNQLFFTLGKPVRPK
jgi:hypothetical protein